MLFHVDQTPSLIGLADVVGKALDAAGLNYRDVERETGIPIATLSRRMKRPGDFKVDELAAIGRLLDTTAGDLLGRAEEVAAA